MSGQFNTLRLFLWQYKSEFIFLDALRQSGITNMLGAAPYLSTAFDLQKKEATTILGLWMKYYDEMKAAGWF